MCKMTRSETRMRLGVFPRVLGDEVRGESVGPAYLGPLSCGFPRGHWVPIGSWLWLKSRLSERRLTAMSASNWGLLERLLIRVRVMEALG